MARTKSSTTIELRGIRHNNLKGFDLDVPVNSLVVVTGPSGSGKSSLAFDTLYAEGQRRYIETFSPYARQFFDRMDKPRVDSIENIPPAIAIEQRNTVRSTRSTVGTMTEICEHMKVLWPHIAQLHCRSCGKAVSKDSPQRVWKSVTAEPEVRDTDCMVTFDLPLSEKLSLEDSLSLISKQGYQRLFLGKDVVRLEEATTHPSFRTARAKLTVVQDRLRLSPTNRKRFIEACEQAYHFGKGRLTIHQMATATASSPHPASLFPLHFSSRLHCATCDVDYPDPTPALFSFNHPVGACPACKGFGRIITIDYNLAIPDRRKTLKQGAVKPWQSGMSAECQRDLLKFCKAMNVPTDVPFQALSAKHQHWIIDGDPDYGVDEEHEWPRAWYGVKGYFRWLESKAYKMHVRVLLSRYRAYTPCPDCQGARLKPDALLYRLHTPAAARTRKPEAQTRTPATTCDQLSLSDVYALPISDALDLVKRLTTRSQIGVTTISGRQSAITHALSEVQSRLQYLDDIGLGYLTLDRPTRTLSGGETARVNLAACLGTRLVNTLFVLDEPSVGLHARDTERLVAILHALRNEGNTVLVVEHERQIIEAADQVIDLGPGHGATGGELVFQGRLGQILKSNASLTGRYLTDASLIDIPVRRPVPLGQKQGRHPAIPALKLSHASRHNIRDLTVEVPLNRFVCISGVSGSGKSTLIRELLLPALQQQLGPRVDAIKASDRLQHDEQSTADGNGRGVTAQITGMEYIDEVVLVDQSTLGKTPRSNPAVYTGAFDHLRQLFATSEEAKKQGLGPSAFSFNSTQGQCERCRGAGFEKVEMQFLSDIFIRCPDCNGRRYREHILEVKLQNPERGNTQALSIADVLESTVDEVVAFLAEFPESRPAQKATDALRWLQDVGLGYLQLGQPINTLSGGESQRLKLVRHLADSGATAEGRRKPTRVTESHGTAPTTRPALLLLDEPTTGLHFDDVRILLKALQRLVEAGHSLVIVEHNLDVLKCADWIIDLGPDAGEKGGQLVVAGPPETVAACSQSHTGRFLTQALNAGRETARSQTQIAHRRRLKPSTQRGKLSPHTS